MPSHPDHLLAVWAEFAYTRVEGLGYSGTTTIGLAAEGTPPSTGLSPSLPRGVTFPGFHAFATVERALPDLDGKHQIVACLENGILCPNGQPLKTQKARAEVRGITHGAYAKQLAKVRERIRLAA